MSTLLQRASVPILALALASCWLTASLSDLADGGASDASPDVERTDGGHDGGVDARRDGSSPPRDVAPPTDTGTDTATSPDASCSGATTYQESVLAATPLAYWRLDEEGGTTAHDLSGHGYNATYSSTGVTYGQLGVADDTSVLLDGISGEIVVDSGSFNSQSEFLGTKAAYSLEAWIQPMAISSAYQGIVSNELAGGSGKEGYVMYLQDEAGVGFDRYNDGTSTPLTKLGVVATGAWYHVVGVYDGKTTMSIYVNGSSVASTPTTLSIVGGCAFAIGATHCGSSGWFQGYMDEVAVYNHALDPTCIAKHYQLGIGK